MYPQLVQVEECPETILPTNALSQRIEIRQVVLELLLLLFGDVPSYIYTFFNEDVRTIYYNT